MKIFAIKENNNPKEIGYLFYYEKCKEFYIELLDGLSEWDIPMLLATLYKKGERTILDYWSRRWVCQRVVPSDRQNIGQILKDNNLKFYDEFDLLCISKGRCEQDNFYLETIKISNLPKDIVERREKRIQNVIKVREDKLFVFFKNNVIKEFKILNKQKGNIDLLVDGYGIIINGQDVITSEKLYQEGKILPITVDEILILINDNIVNTKEAMQLLNCSRQYINELVKNSILHPIKNYDKTTIFLKSEVLKVNNF